MKTKLTLSIDKDLLKEAKKHFKSADQSLSEVIEDYFKRIIGGKRRYPSTVEKTRGILAGAYKGKSYKQIKDDMMRDKYGI